MRDEAQRGVGHGVLGWLLVVLGMLIPGIVAIVSAANPGLGWIEYPSWLNVVFVRTAVAVLGVVLCAGAYGFIRHRRWAWWIVMGWGAVSIVEVGGRAFGTWPNLTILVPQVTAVVFLAYAWRRRRDFGGEFGAARR
ncbi:MAG: hypothetical protein ACC682_00070 [Gemmatimonadota bacterium]